MSINSRLTQLTSDFSPHFWSLTARRCQQMARQSEVRAKRWVESRTTIVTTINVCKTLYLATCYVYSVNKLCKLVSADKGSCVKTNTYIVCFSRQAKIVGWRPKVSRCASLSASTQTSSRATTQQSTFECYCWLCFHCIMFEVVLTSIDNRDNEPIMVQHQWTGLKQNKICCHGDGHLFHDSNSRSHPSHTFVSWSIIDEPRSVCDMWYLHPCQCHRNCSCTNVYVDGPKKSSTTDSPLSPYATNVELLYVSYSHYATLHHFITQYTVIPHITYVRIYWREHFKVLWVMWIRGLRFTYERMKTKTVHSCNQGSVVTICRAIWWVRACVCFRKRINWTVIEYTKSHSTQELVMQS